jgi:hypothetical protein
MLQKVLQEMPRKMLQQVLPEMLSLEMSQMLPKLLRVSFEVLRALRLQEKELQLKI